MAIFARLTQPDFDDAIEFQYPVIMSRRHFGLAQRHIAGAVHGNHSLRSRTACRRAGYPESPRRCLDSVSPSRTSSALRSRMIAGPRSGFSPDFTDTFNKADNGRGTSDALFQTLGQYFHPLFITQYINWKKFPGQSGTPPAVPGEFGIYERPYRASGQRSLSGARPFLLSAQCAALLPPRDVARTIRLLRSWIGRKSLPKICLKALNCACDISAFGLSTIQLTVSEQGGVVSDPG